MDKYRVEPGSRVKLDDWDPRDHRAFDGDKADALPVIQEQLGRLGELQAKLMADRRHALLVVLQAPDTGGKDGTIRHVFEGANPQGVKVASFKQPTSVELAHDYLWRAHAQTPAKGEIAIFNRSHYEDVLVVRVHGLVPEKVWKHRYDQINDFERMLSQEGTTILKLYLHISRKEQLERLEARLDDQGKQWKFDPADLAERRLWTSYRQAYEAMLSRTSTEWAPWYVIPADRKWYRNLLVSRLLVDALSGLDLKYPPLEPQVLEDARRQLREFRAEEGLE